MITKEKKNIMIRQVEIDRRHSVLLVYFSISIECLIIRKFDKYVNSLEIEKSQVGENKYPNILL